jgi:hypothetical protein
MPPKKTKKVKKVKKINQRQTQTQKVEINFNKRRSYSGAGVRRGRAPPKIPSVYNSLPPIIQLPLPQQLLTQQQQKVQEPEKFNEYYHKLQHDMEVQNQKRIEEDRKNTHLFLKRMQQQTMYDQANFRQNQQNVEQQASVTSGYKTPEQQSSEEQKQSSEQQPVSLFARAELLSPEETKQRDTFIRTNRSWLEQNNFISPDGTVARLNIIRQYVQQKTGEKLPKTYQLAWAKISRMIAIGKI